MTPSSDAHSTADTDLTEERSAGTAAPLRIGLLLCDHLDDDVAAQVGDYTELYPAVFGPAGVELSVYEVTRGQFPDRLDAHDGWIVSGSRRSTYEDEPWIHELEDLVNLAVNGEIQEPASGLGEHVNDCWPELVGPADRSLIIAIQIFVEGGRAVRVRGNLEAQHVRLVGDGLHLFQRQLLCARFGVA